MTGRRSNRLSYAPNGDRKYRRRAAARPYWWIRSPAASIATNRYAILYRVHDAKRATTRAARIERFVAMLAAGEKIHQ